MSNPVKFTGKTLVEMTVEIQNLELHLYELRNQRANILDAMTGRPIQQPTLTLPHFDALIA